MAFYDLDKEQRAQLYVKIQRELLEDIRRGKHTRLNSYFAHADTYMRKAAYLGFGRLYLMEKELQKRLTPLLEQLLKCPDEKVRQTAINAAGEIGKVNFEEIAHLMEQGLFDAHHSVRNAVIGSIKKMGEKNPQPVLCFANRFLHHTDKEIRREICHGIELRGRTHPQDILPLLKELQFDKTARVRNTLVHVLGQIAYKKGCLETVVAHLKGWENRPLVEEALAEIIDVHHRYRNFAVKTQDEARRYIQKQFGRF